MLLACHVNVMSEVMRREETMLTPWLIGMGYWRATLAITQSLYTVREVRPVRSDAELFHDASERITVIKSQLRSYDSHPDRYHSGL